MGREPQQDRAINEIIGLVLLGLGTVLFLSLYSYESKDLPFFNSAPNKPAHNFIGPVGAIMAGTVYFLFGAAAYLIAVVLLGFGSAKLFFSKIQIVRKLPYILCLILSGACLLQLQHQFLVDWSKMVDMRGLGAGPGGLVGELLGKSLFKETLFGRLGAPIVLLCIYVGSLVLMTGLHPILLLRRLVSLPGDLLQRYQNYRVQRANECERLEIEREKLQKEARKLEKKLKKQGIAPLPQDPSPAEEAEPDSEPEPEKEIVNRPPPQIIDTGAVVQPAKPREKEKPKKEKLEAVEPVHMENYRLPELDLLDEIDVASRQAANPEELMGVQAMIIDTLGQFGIEASPGDITKGPTITRFEVYPAKGVRVDRIVSLERDIARATRAERINILAPIPGKDTVGIEIANSRKVKVILRELMQSEDWTHAKARIPLALGKDVYGKTIIADLAQMPHCLVAGATGSGKSVCINSMISSMLFKFTPDELGLIMIDPKVVEMQIYNKLPHLIVPVVTDPKKVLLALRWVIDEMEKRYRIFAKVGVRNITSFNARPMPKSQKELDAEKAANAINGEASEEAIAELEDENLAEDDGEEEEEETPIRVPRDAEELIIPDRMRYIVVIIDELADLMQTAPADVESAIARITQMARAAGIHMIVATQTPRADIVTGVIKANIPSRVAFQVSSKLDSRIILDEGGAERLLGQGDMLYLPPGTSRLVRSQGVLVTDEEIHRLVEFVSAQATPAFESAIHARLQSSASMEEEVSEEDEELVEKCLEIMRQEKKASTSLFQRRLKLGYTRAARVVDILESRGVVGPGEGAKPREILVDLDTLT
jgi:S-DNA-T family DNA segregation ATPase FtsK/SpoIIIE